MYWYGTREGGVGSGQVRVVVVATGRRSGWKDRWENESCGVALALEPHRPKHREGAREQGGLATDSKGKRNERLRLLVQSFVRVALSTILWWPGIEGRCGMIALKCPRTNDVRCKVHRRCLSLAPVSGCVCLRTVPRNGVTSRRGAGGNHRMQSYVCFLCGEGSLGLVAKNDERGGVRKRLSLLPCSL